MFVNKTEIMINFFGKVALKLRKWFYLAQNQLCFFPKI